MDPGPRHRYYIALLLLAVFVCIGLALFHWLRPTQMESTPLTYYHDIIVTSEQDVIVTSPARGALRVAILMWYDKNIEKYANMAWKVNCMYGQRHGFDVIRSSRPRDPSLERDNFGPVGAGEDDARVLAGL